MNATCGSSSASTEYLVSYGLTGELGRFSAPAGGLARWMRVILQTSRGVEIGEVLRPASPRLGELMGDAPAGDLLRPATTDDERRAAEQAAMAAAFRAAVARVLRGETVDGVMRFPDRAAWLAALLWDHARGEARGRWSYAKFAQLDALPAEYVPRQLFAAEPGMVRPVLLRLHAERRLAAWLNAIGERMNIGTGGF